MTLVPARAQYTRVATIERVDNGALLTVRNRSSGGDTVILKKVYDTPTLMIADLLEALDFKVVS